MTKAATVYDVADRAGVSIATVSRVLRRPDDVADATRERVLAVVRELGYVPSGSARGLAGRRTGVFGLLLPGHDAVDDLDDAVIGAPDAIGVVDDRLVAGAATRTSGRSFFDEVVRGAEAEAWRRGYALMIAAGRGTSREFAVSDVAGRVDGLVVVSTTVPDDVLARVARRVPVVVVADSQPTEVHDTVSAANEAGMHALVTEVLRTRQIRTVLFLAGPTESPDAADRRAGVLRALAGTGVRLEERAAGFEGAQAAMRIRELLGSRDPSHPEWPDAVIAANDQSALGALEALVAAGVRVPERTVVTGFDGIEAGRFSTPRLTTVHQPMAMLGRVAVSALARRVADPALAPQRLSLPVEVLLRESCPPAP